MQLIFKRNFSSRETILNPLNIQILGKSLSEKVFPSRDKTVKERESVQMQTLELSRNHLESHTIPWQKERQLLPEIPGNLIPNLLGESGSLNEHFMRMAADLSNEYFKLAMDFCSKTSRPKAPGIEAMKLLLLQLEKNRKGWFKWNPIRNNWEDAPEGPIDKVIIFDVETCPQISQFPILACAYGPSGWYIWLQPDNLEQNMTEKRGRLITLKHPILVIGHHVAYDRARVLEEYTSLDRRECRFLDTLSMHCAVAGLSSQQRGLWQERKKRISLQEEVGGESGDFMDSEKSIDHEKTEKWGSRSSLNNLSDALQLHCNRKLDKSVRDDILLKSSSPAEIFAAFPEIMAYCAKDVEATSELFSVLLPKFLKKSPNPVTFAALLEMGSFVLPIDKSSWQRYIDECEVLYEQATRKIEKELSRLVDETVAVKFDCNDSWLSQLDWTLDPVRYTKARYLKDGVTYAKGGEPRPILNCPWIGKPAWFKKLVKAGKVHVTPRTSIVPLLLKLKWRGKVVHLIPGYGWCIERECDDPSLSLSGGDKIQIIPFNGKKYQRIPHPGGRDENVGCLLTKNFLKHFKSGDLSTENGLIEQVLEVNSKFSFWTSYRDRVKEQFIVESDGLKYQNRKLNVIH